MKTKTRPEEMDEQYEKARIMKVIWRKARYHADRNSCWAAIIKAYRAGLFGVEAEEAALATCKIGPFSVYVRN